MHFSLQSCWQVFSISDKYLHINESFVKRNIVFNKSQFNRVTKAGTRTGMQWAFYKEMLDSFSAQPTSTVGGSIDLGQDSMHVGIKEADSSLESD